MQDKFHIFYDILPDIKLFNSNTIGAAIDYPLTKKNILPYTGTLTLDMNFILYL